MAPNLTKNELTEEQIAEQIERDNERGAGDGIEDQQDDSRVEPGNDDEPRGQDEPAREKPVQMSPQDQKRADMANRFKRPGVEQPFDGDMTRDENLYGDVAAEVLEDPDEPAADAAAAQAPAPAERTFTIKVRGKDVQLTEAEVLERARKVEAADSYLAESREILESAKTIRAERAGPDRQPQDGERSADEQDQTDHSQARPNAPSMKSVVEKIQFGDPEEAARELEQVIDTAASKKANEGHVARLVSNDLVRSKAALKAFSDANPDLANDSLAMRLMEESIYDVYREELVAQGVNEASIPKDKLALADFHRLHRVHQHQVSSVESVLKEAKSRLDRFRGAPSVPVKPAPRKDAARVNVNVDRTERRMAIPVQPSRAVAPRRDAAPVVQQDSRKTAVQEMRRARGQPVV